MFDKVKYVGVALESDAFNVVQVQATSNGLKLLKLDRIELVESTEQVKDTVFSNGDSGYHETRDVSGEQVFGLDEDDSSQGKQKEEVDFTKLEAQASSTDAFKLGEVDDENGSTNYVLLYNILNKISKKRVDLAVNIPAGNTIYQTLDDEDYREVKEKELVDSIETKLQAIYGEQKSADFYAYEIREDGSLLLASIDESPAMLGIVDETKEFYRGRLKLKEIYSDEVALAGLFRVNYRPDPNDITALIQFGERSCRIMFLKGDEIYHITPPVNEGTDSRNFMNVLFSKILFQLDTDFIPALNRIVIANNSIGDKAVDFFKSNFPACEVENFTYKDSFLDREKFDETTLNPYTTAIALGAAVVQKDEEFPRLSMMPDYVRERQKIFKLEWHGILLLILIFLTFPVFNYFYQHNAAQIETLTSDLNATNNRITEIEPIVQRTNEVSQNLTLLSAKLSLLDSLSTDSKAWSTKIDIIDQGMGRIPNAWLTSMAKTQDGTFIEGYALYRNRIPAVVELFADATLLNVNIEEVRDEQLFKFSMIARKFTNDSTQYSPKKSENIEQLLNN